jgi:hypothetical protein
MVRLSACNAQAERVIAGRFFLKVCLDGINRVGDEVFDGRLRGVVVVCGGLNRRGSMGDGSWRVFEFP